MPKLPPVVYASAPAPLAQEALDRFELRLLVDSGLLDAYSPTALVARLRQERARDLVELAEKLPVSATVGLLEHERRVTVRHALLAHPELPAELAGRILRRDADDLPREVRAALVARLEPTQLIDDERLLREAYRLHNDRVVRAVTSLLHTSAGDDARQADVLRRARPDTVAAALEELSHFGRGADVIGGEALQVAVEVLRAMPGDAQRSSATQAVGRLLSQVADRLLAEGRLAQVVDAASFVERCSRASTARDVWEACMARALVGTADDVELVVKASGPMASRLLLEMDVVHHERVLELLAEQKPVTVLQAAAFVARLVEHHGGPDTTLRGDDDEVVAARRRAEAAGRSVVRRLVAPLRDAQPALAACGGHGDLAEAAISKLEPREQGRALQALVRSGTVASMQPEQLASLLSAVDADSWRHDRTRIMRALPAALLHPQVIAALCSDSGSLVVEQLIDTRLDALSDEAALALIRSAKSPEAYRLLGAREWADTLTLLRAWQEVPAHYVGRALHGLGESPLPAVVARSLAIDVPEDAVGAVVEVSGPEQQWPGVLRAALVAHTPLPRLLKVRGWSPSSSRDRGGQIVASHLRDVFGEDQEAWQTALTLMEDWEQPLGALVEAVQALRPGRG